jgi:hypothetical protein
LRNADGFAAGLQMSSVVLTPVKRGRWRVKIAWPDTPSRYFGKFNSQAEAERWIAEHQWLIEQHQEPDRSRQEYRKGTSDRD